MKPSHIYDEWRSGGAAAERTQKVRELDKDTAAGSCLDAGAYEDLARIYRALGHPARLSILDTLAKGKRACCGDIVRCLPLAQSTVSQHLQVLKEAGLLTCEVSGRSCHYTLDTSRLVLAAAASGSFLASVSSAADAPAVGCPDPSGPQVPTGRAKEIDFE